MAETKKKATAEVKEEAKAEKKPAAKKAPAKKAAAPKKEAAPEAAPKAEEKKPAKKKAEVKAEPVKAKVTEAHAVARDVRVTPRKVRLVMDLVRGKSVNEALELLFHVNKAASDPVAKLIKSAAANATNNFGMAGDKLYVAEIQASDGVRMKRFEPRGKGASSPIIKRTSFMRVTVKER
ncbi:MAG: 50S ribosomal protein L22 [Bacilli bacterium]|jgi:large subunit ribosomal protein L22|nr:50S ribosomal protein L22 [Bacilli bacterium]MBR5991081.1 50S ribosomal protein L22 [Bacilli bacterium]